MPSDVELVEQALRGDHAAFGEIVRRYQDAVYGLAFHHVGSYADAQDLAQEVFIGAYRRLAQLRDPAKLAPWLRRMTQRQCLSWLRSRRDLQSLDAMGADEPAGDGRTPPEEAEARELQATVRRALDTLPEGNRLAVTLFYIDGLSQEEIAGFLGVSPAVVSTRIHRAKRRLKERMVGILAEELKEHALPEDFPERVMAQVVGIKVDEPQNFRVVLRDADLRSLWVCIGPFEAQSIAMSLQGQKTERPMTYDLVANILAGLGYRLAEAQICELRNQTYYAKLVLAKGRQRKEFDARASDAINLALRMGAPVYVAEEVMRAVSTRNQDAGGRVEACTDGTALLHLEGPVALTVTRDAEGRAVLPAGQESMGAATETAFISADVMARFRIPDGAQISGTIRPPAEDDVPTGRWHLIHVSGRSVEGVVDLREGGDCFVRVEPGRPSPGDVFVPAPVAAQHALQTGQRVRGNASPPAEGEEHWRLTVANVVPEAP